MVQNVAICRVTEGSGIIHFTKVTLTPSPFACPVQDANYDLSSPLWTGARRSHLLCCDHLMATREGDFSIVVESGLQGGPLTQLLHTFRRCMKTKLYRWAFYIIPCLHPLLHFFLITPSSS